MTKKSPGRKEGIPCQGRQCCKMGRNQQKDRQTRDSLPTSKKSPSLLVGWDRSTKWQSLLVQVSNRNSWNIKLLAVTTKNRITVICLSIQNQSSYIFFLILNSEIFNLWQYKINVVCHQTNQVSHKRFLTHKSTYHKKNLTVLFTSYLIVWVLTFSSLFFIVMTTFGIKLFWSYFIVVQLVELLSGLGTWYWAKIMVSILKQAFYL